MAKAKKGSRAETVLCPVFSGCTCSTTHPSRILLLFYPKAQLIGESDFQNDGLRRNSNLKRSTKPNVHSSTIYSSQDKEATWLLTDGWIDEVAHIYDRILPSHKKEWNKAICSNMDGPRGHHTKWSQSEKDRYHSHVESKNLMQMNLFTNQKQTDRHKLTFTKSGEKDRNLGLTNKHYYI